MTVVFLSTLPYLYSASIHVTITNVKEPKGEVIIYLFKGSEGFMDPDSARGIVKIEASDYEKGHTFCDLETGEYVVIRTDKDRTAR